MTNDNSENGLNEYTSPSSPDNSGGSAMTDALIAMATSNNTRNQANTNGVFSSPPQQNRLILKETRKKKSFLRKVAGLAITGFAVIPFLVGVFAYGKNNVTHPKTPSQSFDQVYKDSSNLKFKSPVDEWLWNTVMFIPKFTMAIGAYVGNVATSIVRESVEGGAVTPENRKTYEDYKTKHGLQVNVASDEKPVKSHKHESASANSGEKQAVTASGQKQHSTAAKPVENKTSPSIEETNPAAQKLASGDFIADAVLTKDTKAYQGQLPAGTKLHYLQKFVDPMHRINNSSVFVVDPAFYQDKNNFNPRVIIPDDSWQKLDGAKVGFTPQQPSRPYAKVTQTFKNTNG